MSQHRAAHLRLENGSLTVPAKCKIRREGEEGLKCNTSIFLKQASIRSLGISAGPFRCRVCFWTDALWFGNVRIKPAVAILIVLFNASHHVLVHPKHSHYCIQSQRSLSAFHTHCLYSYQRWIEWMNLTKTWAHLTLKSKNFFYLNFVLIEV